MGAEGIDLQGREDVPEVDSVLFREAGFKEGGRRGQAQGCGKRRQNKEGHHQRQCRKCHQEEPRRQEEKATKEDEDSSKENSKNGANTKSGSGVAAAAGGPLPLDVEGLPPLRKTAVNPAFKRKKESETEEPSSNNKVLKTEDLKGKENDEKEKSAEVSARKEPKKNEEKSKLEKEPKHKVEASSKEGEDEPMEVDSPVKSSKKKKKRVLDSD